MCRQLLLIFAVLLFFPISVWALNETELDRVSAEIFDSVMSPYCPGRTLSACPSDQARELRDEIRSDLSQGKSEQDVRSSLAQKFGDIAGRPRPGASNAVAYAGITIFFIIGLLLVVANIGKGRKLGEEHDQEES